MVHNVNGFAPRSIKSAFSDSFARLGDEGAALSVFFKGEEIVSLWGGFSSDQNPWTEDTLVNVFSASKGALAIALLQQLDATGTPLTTLLGDILSHCSPDVAATSLSQLLSHTSGLVAFHDQIGDQELYNYRTMFNHSKQEASWFRGKDTLSYSPFLWGWLVYGVIETLSGGEPEIEGVNYQLDEASRPVAYLSACKAKHEVYRESSLKSLMSPSGSEMTRSAFLNPVTQMVGSNGSSWRQALIPAANGHTSATQLARSYSRFAATSGAQLARAELSSGNCSTVGTSMRFSAGFMLPQQTKDTMFGTVSNGFGHSGAGGSFGFGDSYHELSVSYVTRAMGQSLFMDERGVMITSQIFKYLGIDPYE